MGHSAQAERRVCGPRCSMCISGLFWTNRATDSANAAAAGCRPRGASTPRLRIRTLRGVHVHGCRAVGQQENGPDWAHFLNDMARPYPCAEKITLVMVNTHGPGSLTFEPTWPKRCGIVSNSCSPDGSWLNMAEIELMSNAWTAGSTISTRSSKWELWQKRRNNAK